jgi:hypothetical protein
MKFKFFLLFFLIISCSANFTKMDSRKPYNAKGFALIFNENDYEAKIINNKLNNEISQISHKNLRTGSLIKLINPKNKKSLVLKNFKKIKYPDFYKILITKKVANELGINVDLPLIEVLEIKKNKSFIAKKAIIYNEEKKIPSKAPVTSVQILNISKKKPVDSVSKVENIYIFVASFYTNEAANLLKSRIIQETPNFNITSLSIKKKSSKEFEVLSGPYKSINSLKNDYIELKKFGFEELDIYINE